MRLLKVKGLQIIGLLLWAAVPLQAQDGWQPLINGDDLDGWTQLGGEAIYQVEDGVIVGKAVPDTLNSCLATEADYSDVILEYEGYLDTEINSRQQIRSQSNP